MAKKHFYEDLIETSDISVELAEMQLSHSERVKLLSLVNANIHTVVIDTVLSGLSKEDKKVFLKNLVSNDHKKTWEHLKSKTNNIEEKIKRASEKIKKELLEDLKKVKKLEGRS